MRLTYVRVESEAAAVALARRLSEPPRCGHYRWKLDPLGVRRWDRLCGPRGRRGRVPPCLCASAADVHPDCPWVTWQTVVVQRLSDGAVVLGIEDPDRHGETRLAARAVLTESERDEAEPVWSVRAERRMERATPAERSSRG